MSEEKRVELSYPCTGKKSLIGKLVLVLEDPDFKKSKEKGGKNQSKKEGKGNRSKKKV